MGKSLQPSMRILIEPMHHRQQISLDMYSRKERNRRQGGKPTVVNDGFKKDGHVDLSSSLVAPLSYRARLPQGRASVRFELQDLLAQITDLGDDSSFGDHRTLRCLDSGLAKDLKPACLLTGNRASVAARLKAQVTWSARGPLEQRNPMAPTTVVASLQQAGPTRYVRPPAGFEARCEAG
jgi:hypothetical protein